MRYLVKKHLLSVPLHTHIGVAIEFRQQTSLEHPNVDSHQTISIPQINSEHFSPPVAHNGNISSSLFIIKVVNALYFRSADVIRRIILNHSLGDSNIPVLHTSVDCPAAWRSGGLGAVESELPHAVRCAAEFRFLH